MAILLVTEYEDPGEWRKRLDAIDPAIELRVWPEIGTAADIVLIAADMLPEGVFAGLPNLKCVQFLGHGAAHVIDHADRPAHVAVARLTDPGIIRSVTEHALALLMSHRRFLAVYDVQQGDRLWRHYASGDPTRTCVAVLGLGSIGTRIAEALAALEYRVVAWAQSSHRIAGVECRHGADALDGVLGDADYVISILPGTQATVGLLGARAFAAMKRGAYFINVGRGLTVDEDALIAALDEGALSGAALDVFQTEPLAADSPLWGHPKVRVTPHAAGGRAAASIESIAENHRRAAAGEPLINIADPEKGY
ncbi:MAG: NAD(P)-dependent oxidoreductase [Rhodospirillales bacterium]|jgi:glyoxylate/hydroxypyruvate reductase A|nr:NAD(P)-dependent oxidoreductase [Rhodospirillales bacterium]